MQGEGASEASSRQRSMEATAAKEGTSQPPQLFTTFINADSKEAKEGPSSDLEPRQDQCGTSQVPGISSLHELQHGEEHACMPASTSPRLLDSVDQSGNVNWSLVPTLVLPLSLELEIRLGTYALSRQVQVDLAKAAFSA